MNIEKTEVRKLRKKICRKAGVSIRDNKLIEEGDHILLGLSGGKDSMILLEVLADRKAALPFDFQITACHVEVEDVGYKAGTDAMASLCKELDIPFIQRSVQIEKSEQKEKGICFLCSWQRRKALFELGKELSCNKLALGHHRYDALETLLINMIYHGSISSLPYSLKMFEGRMNLVRPLLDLDENLLAAYAAIREFNSEGKSCNHEDVNKRTDIREIIDRIEELHGRGAYNMFKSMDKIIEEYLPQKKARTS